MPEPLLSLRGVRTDIGRYHILHGVEFDVAEGGLLLDEATWQLRRDGDARKAVVAQRFASRRLAPPRVRGILDDDRTALDLFDAVVRYGPVEPSAVAVAA